MSKLVQLREEFAAKQKALANIFDQAGTDFDFTKVTAISGTTEEKVAEVRRLNTEIGEISKQVEALAALEGAKAANDARGREMNAPAGGIQHPNGGAAGDGAKAVKELGDLFIGSQAFKGYAGGRSPVAQIEGFSLKTLMETSVGWAPEVTRNGHIEMAARRPLKVSELVSMTETNQAAVKFMRETAFTNAALETAEGAAYPEAELGLTEDSEMVRKLAVFLPITDEQLEDEPRVRDYVNNRLTRMLRERLDGQILNGDGIAPNLSGILSTAGIQTQALGADVVLDALYKAITKVRHTGFAEPDAVVLHPNDWQAIRLVRTTDGIYIWGNPAQAGPETVWGLPVVVTPAIAENTGLVGAFREFAEVAMKRGIDFQISNSHDGYFAQGIQAIRADFRCAMVVLRPAAFCTVTGI